MKYSKKECRKIKYKVLYWLRIKQRCCFIATEVGGWSADVLGINEKKMIEVEIKISKQDLLNDAKKSKHYFYKKDSGLSHETSWIPNQFYYAVPTKLVQDCRNYLEKHKFENYGIIDSDQLIVIKRAKPMHDKEPNTRVKFVCALRMGSELLRFHEAML